MSRTKIAFVLSAGENTRLPEAPEGGKAHVDLGDGTTPWTRAKGQLEAEGWMPFVVELESNLRPIPDGPGPLETIPVRYANGPAGCVRQAIDFLASKIELYPEDYNLMIWFGDTVLRHTPLPRTTNYAMTCLEAPSYDRPWDWSSAIPSRYYRGTMTQEEAASAGWHPCIGIYHVARPEVWVAAADSLMAPLEELDVSSPDPSASMVDVANAYVDLAFEEYGALHAMALCEPHAWRDTGESDTLIAFRNEVSASDRPT